MLFKWFQYLEPGSTQNIIDGAQEQLTRSEIISLVSAGIGLISAIICLAAFILSLYVAIKDSKNRFQKNVSSCLGPISRFIHDSYLILSEGHFRDMSYVCNGENQLLEGITSLYTFASTNGYKNLKEAMTINPGNDEEDEKSFSFCFLELEDKYMSYREKHIKGQLNGKTANRMEAYNLFFRRYLKLFSKNLYKFKSKKPFSKKSSYYKALKKIKKEVEEYGSKNSQKTQN